MSDSPVKLTEIRKEDLLVLLKRSGSRKAATETIEADIAAGAPLNSDGTRVFCHRQQAGFRISSDGRTVNLFKYLA